MVTGLIMDTKSEPTATELANRQLIVEVLIYSTSTCHVYKAFDRRRNQLVVLKFLSMPVNNSSSGAIQREVENQMSCRHPNIVELLDIFWYYLSSTTWVAVLELEQMMKDLITDIQFRLTNHFPYDEERLSDYFRTLVEVFAFAQDKGIAHRDVKPHNLFLSGSTIKVGDFGSSRHIPLDPLYLTLAGTPSYLSPLLRQGLFTSRRYLAHNPFKSDVYSFGLTILHMANLHCILPSEELNAAVQRSITGSQYSESLKVWLRWILTYDEANRPDFVEIRAALQGSSPSLQTPVSNFACEHSQTPSPVQLTCRHSLCKDCFEDRLVFLSNCMQIICTVCGQHTEYMITATTVTTVSSELMRMDRIVVHTKAISAFDGAWTGDMVELSSSIRKPEGRGPEAISSMNSLPRLNQGAKAVVAIRVPDQARDQSIFESLSRQMSFRSSR